MNPLHETLKSEVERLFTLSELNSIMTEYLDLDPSSVGSEATGKAARVAKCFDLCVREGLVEALADVVIGLKGKMVDPRVHQIAHSVVPYDPVSGTLPGGVTVGKEIGRGGFGVVFDARREGTETPLAVKIARLDLAGAASTRARYVAQMRLLARKGLDAVPRIVYVGKAPDGAPFVLYEKAEGKTLDRVAGDEGMPFDAACRVLISILDRLASMHGQQVPHGDLRPGKVVISGEGEGLSARLLLPGNSRLLQHPQGDVAHTVRPVGGAPAYMAPEQMRGEEADARTDVFLFGVVAVKALTGQLPWKGRNAAECVAARLGSDPALPRALKPRGEIPESVDRLVAKCLEREPSRRFSDVVAIRKDLEAILGSWVDARDESRKVRPATKEEFEDMSGEFLQDPDVEELMEETVILARGSGEWVRLIEVMNQAIAGADDGALKMRLLYRLATVFEKDVKDFDEAAGCYKKILEIDGSDANANIALEECMRKARQWEGLVDILLDRAAGADEPVQQRKLFTEISRIYEAELDQLDKAIVVLLPIFVDDPGNDEMAAAVTRLARALGRWDEVFATVNQAIERPGQPEKAATLCNRMGRWYLEDLGRADFALPCYQKALTISPGDPVALLGLEGLYRSQSNWAELATVLKRRIEVVKSPAERRDLQASLGSIQITQLHDVPAATDIFSAILKEDPIHEDAFQSLERICIKEERWEELARITEARANALTDPVARKDAFYALAETCETRLQNLEKASGLYAKVLELQPDHIPSLKALEVIHAQTGDYKELNRVLEKQTDIASTPKQRIDLMMRRASIHEEEFLDSQAALALAEGVLEIDPRMRAALDTKARILKKLERWEDIVPVLERQVELEEDGPRKADLLKGLASLLAGKFGRFGDAADSLARALEIRGGSDLEIMDLLVEACEKSDRCAEAASWLERSSELESGEKRADRLVAAGELIELKFGDRERATGLYRRALDAHPTHVKAAAAMRTTFASRGDHGAALDMLRKEIDATKGDLEKARLWAEMGRISRIDLKDPSRAIEYYEKAHGLDPTLVEAGEPLAELYREMQRWDQALKIFEKFAASAEAMESGKAAELFYRYCEASLERNDLDGAKKALDRARGFDPRDPRILCRSGRVAFLRGEHKESVQFYEDYLLRMGDELEPAAKVEIVLSLAKSAEGLGDLARAVERLDKVIELEPGNAEALDLRAKLHERRENWAPMVDDLRAYMRTGIPDDDRFAILVRIADVLKEKMGESDKAAKSLQAALEVKPDDRATLLKFMQLNMGLERWSKVVEVVLKLADLVTDKKELATYYKTAANLNDHYLDRKDDALTYYELALDNDPGQLKLFDSIVAILVDKQDWHGLEKAYQKMLNRLPEGTEATAKANLWHSLGEVYHHRLDQIPDAINAYETALELDPGERSWQEVLADLYGDNLRYSEKALRLNREILVMNPFRTNSFRTLYRIYRKKARYDEAWCIADTLHALNMADDDEMEIYEAYRTEEPAAALERVNDDMWSRYLCHPLLDDKITGIFRAIEPAVLKAKAQQPKSAGLKEEYLIDPAEHPDLLPRTFHYASGVMGVELPPFYLLKDDADLGVVFTPTWPPAIAVGGRSLKEEDPQLLAFVAARHLACYMPGFKMRVFLQSGTSLSTWLLAAIKSAVPQFPVPGDFKTKVTDAVALLKKGLDEREHESLATRVQTFIESATGGIDLKRWASAVDFTADRAGLLLSCEMKVAVSVIKNMPVDSWVAPVKERLAELNLFSVSEDYFTLREKLGIAIQTE